MTIEKADEGVDHPRNVLVGIRFDKESKELVGWALVKVAEPQDHVITVHVSRNSEEASKDKLLLDDYLGIYKGICDIKKVKLSGKVLVGKSIRKVLVKQAKECAAAAVIVGINKLSFSTWVSTAKYCAKHLPPTIEVFTVHNGKVVFQRTSSNDHLTAGLGDPRPSFNKASKHTDTHSEFGDHEASEISSNSPKTTIRESESTGSTESSGELVVVVAEEKSPLSVATKVSPRRSVSINSCHVDGMMEQRPGWPLLRRPSLPTQRALDARKMSVVQWVMSLPDRTPPDTPQSSSNSSSCSMSSKSEDRETATSARSDGVFGRKSSSPFAWNELVEDPGSLFESNASDFTWFSYEVLSHATSQFSSENLIGKGGCSRVYKGVFMDGKQVAVKVMKSSKQSWKDFSLEVNIMSSQRHKNITPLLGVCIDNSTLISVYGFMSKGSLEENLLVEEQKTSMSWEARYRVAVGIAEALHYLHNGCTKSVIHRDVKSSNILLSDDFEPQLSDFGLAIWGPSSSSFETYTDVVGTFGYLAPEYFMYGKVSDKLDVYSFGVVLLELLSGRKPIDSSKGQESLVMWAKPILDSGKLKGLVDPNLAGNFDESQMQRMVVAATLCLTRAARLRPDMSQILKLLNGEEKVETWEKPLPLYEEEGDREEFDDNNDDDEVYKQSSNAKSTHLSLALLDVEDDNMSCSSVERSHNPCLEDYLKGRCSRSSSFD